MSRWTWGVSAGVLFTGGVFGFGCPTTACDGDIVDSDSADSPHGEAVDADHWESNRVEGTWLLFSPQRFWRLHPKHFKGRRLRAPIVYISNADDPARAGERFTVASGNLAETGVWVDGDGNPSFFVHNNTCASYFMRTEVEAYPAEDGGTDAASDADSGTPSDANAE